MLSYLICFLALTTTAVFGGVCIKPAEVSATSFTTQDATVVSEIALVAEFSLKCSNGVVPDNLYADIDGLITYVAKIDDKFQVSWTEDIKKAQRGDRNIRIFDEEGYATLRKTLRSGDDSSAVEPLVTVVVNHPGAFNGPWLKSEFIAAVLSIVVAYVAFSSKAKLLA
ncbi:translocon-associated protein subunit delta [Chrysoperla carnea]|uniref:translocon-associated protein subunit delta n=1 Tax=Chrysoperla carnea TaxID=189513 RepID=UPI001D05C492|nr:translocon-associated protein subunit delta [Chrysoperla carnea]